MCLPSPLTPNPRPARHPARAGVLPLWNPCSIVNSKCPTIFRSNAYSPQPPRAAALPVSPNFGHGTIPRQSHDTKN